MLSRAKMSLHTFSTFEEAMNYIRQQEEVTNDKCVTINTVLHNAKVKFCMKTLSYNYGIRVINFELV